MLRWSIFTFSLLLLPSASLAQVDTSLSAVVRISGSRGSETVTGTGFVVGVEPTKATIVTSGHVIAGMETFKVSFAVDPGGQYTVDSKSVLGMESDSQRGAGVFQVRGALPEGITSLSFDAKAEMKSGDAVLVTGWRRDLAPQTLRKSFARADGNFLRLSSTVVRGFSGSPVLRNGSVVGIVVAEDGQDTIAIKSIVAEDAVKGWGVKLGGTTLSAGPDAPLAYIADAENTTLMFFSGMFFRCAPEGVLNAAGFILIRICHWSNSNVRAPKEAVGQELLISAGEITNQQYRHFRPTHPGEATLPVTQASWADAKAFCEHFGTRLPTAAESEYASRESIEMARILRQEVKAGSVAKKEPNIWGFYYIRGKAAEWVADRYGSYSGAPQTAPAVSATGKAQVVGNLPKPISFRCAKGAS